MKRTATLALCLLALVGCSLEDRLGAPVSAPQAKAQPAQVSSASSATPTEHLGIRVLSAPGAVTVDSRLEDWDLRGGVFINGNVESQRDTYGVWFHTMYDADHLYILGRFLDATPLNNPGAAGADEGFNGDSLQVRIATAYSTPEERVTHLTNWLDRTGKSAVNIAYGRKFDEGSIQDAQTQGVRQSFRRNPDSRGYVQEIAIPWKLLTRGGRPLRPGTPLRLTVEPNFTLGERGRVTLKDVFQPGVKLDRVFTFQAVDQWGTATLVPSGSVALQPVRLADGREFPVRLEGGLPVVDWTGLNRAQAALPGFKPIRLSLPVAGYVSLNIKNSDGLVVRQLLSSTYYPKGEHTVQWDGLSTTNGNTRGQPVAAGEYTWSALYHTGLGLSLRGWAANSGKVPWDAPGGRGNWGGDHGQPSAVAADETQVYLAWSGAEAGKSLLATDLEGNVLWGHNRAGLAGVKAVAADGGSVYVLGGSSGPAAEGGALYKLAAKTGEYRQWGTATDLDLTIGRLWPDPAGKPQKADGLAAHNRLLYLTFTAENLVAVVDGDTGKFVRTIALKAPGALKVVSDSLAYALSGTDTVVALDLKRGTARTVAGVKNAAALAVDGQGLLYVGVRAPDNQVKVFEAGGKPVRTIGRMGGRALLGPWTPDGIAFMNSLAIDGQGKLWVAEADSHPKRISAWDRSGKLYKEFFGPSGYGAVGGTINPVDPNLVIGQSSEWRIDPRTGVASCLGTVSREDMAVVRYGTGSNGRLYLAVAPLWFNQGRSPIQIFERLGDGKFTLRTVLSYDQATQQLRVWADENGDAREQPTEISLSSPVALRGWLSGWYLNMAPSLTFYVDNWQMPVSGFTASGAPRYDPTRLKPLPPAPENSQATLGGVDGRVVLYDGSYGADETSFVAYETASGKKLWEYPDNFVGVHGSHRAPPPKPGLIRGAFPLVGVVRLPAPVGNLWAIPTNVGEWHFLTEAGFYLGPLFQSDPFKIEWPAAAVPGAVMTNAPPGAGGEDFGGSIVQAKDGKVYLQAGKTAYWNLELTGLDTVKAIEGGRIAFVAEDRARATALRETQMQAAVGPRRLTLSGLTPRLSGDFDADFKGAEVVQFQKQADAAVRATAAYDRENLYLAWDVADKTPWINQADAPEFLYTRGDTVDFQLGTDPRADRQRAGAILGDLRLSIGNFKGTPTAVLYREIAGEKRPKVFSSGVVKAYRVESVQVLAQARINVKLRPEGYVVEAAIPLAALGLKPTNGLKLTGDFGATHSDPGGQDTVLRTFWSDQQTGLVNDDVLELKLVPRNWGELSFGPGAK